MADKHMIWSNREPINIEDWKDGYAEFLEINNLDRDPNDEDAIYAWAQETRDEYLNDERANLNIQLSQPILVIADIGRWNGRFSGYREIESGNISDCLERDNDYNEWYVDESGELCGVSVHHDGTNYYTYRVYKDDVTDDQIEDLKDKLYDGTATQADIDAVTRKLGEDVAKVYGWNLSAPKIDMSPYENKGFDNAQLAQIRAGLSTGLLTAEQVAIYAKPEFSAPQMAQIRHALESRLAIEPFADPKISWQELAEIRKELLEEQKYGFALNEKAGLDQQIASAEAQKTGTTPASLTDPELGER